MTNRQSLRLEIDKARRAQLDEQGGYQAVERDARRRDRELGTGPFQPTAGRRRIEELAAENRDLRQRLKTTQATLARTRKQRDRWRARADKKHPGWWHPKAHVLYKNGSTYTSIASRFDVDLDTVMDVLEKNGKMVA